MLAATCAALAIAFAAPGSRVVLATSGGSPDWLLGPFRGLGWSGADGDAAGPLFYAGLWTAMVAYVVVVAGARGIGPRLAAVSIGGLHALFLLAPPLLSQDVFSYIAYARLDVVHGLDPYTTNPDAVPLDPAFAFAGSKDAESVYGPLFTFLTLPLAKLGVAEAFWSLKAVATLCSLGVAALTWAVAGRLGRDPATAAMVVGLNPLVLVHVVGGAHNDALVVLLWMGAALALVAAPRTAPLAGGLLAASTAVKASAALLGPFMLIGARNRAAFAAAGAAVAVLCVAGTALVFGSSALEAFGLLGQNQDRTTRWSVPQRVTDGIVAVTGASADTAIEVVRALAVAAFALALVVLLREAWRRRDVPGGWIAPAGWATLWLLVASAWLVPWYAIWLLPLAALGADRRLLTATLMLCAYMLVIAVPL